MVRKGIIRTVAFFCFNAGISGSATLRLGYFCAKLCTCNDLSGSYAGSNLYLDFAFELGRVKWSNMAFAHGFPKKAMTNHTSVKLKNPYTLLFF
jgi:hypothetical protein